MSETIEVKQDETWGACDILKLYKNTSLKTDQVLDLLVNLGYAPALLFDDDGRWAVSFEGAQPMVMGDSAIEMTVSVFIEKEMWKGSIREALIYAIENIDE
jgi:hypothetical protein